MRICLITKSSCFENEKHQTRVSLLLELVCDDCTCGLIVQFSHICSITEQKKVNRKNKNKAVIYKEYASVA